MSDPSSPRTVLRVTASYAFSLAALGRALAVFAATHPDIEVHGLIDDETLDLAAEGFDAGIRIGVHGPTDLPFRFIATVRRMLVASPGYLARHGTPERPADLAHHRFLTYSLADGATTLRFDEETGGSHEVTVDGVFRVNNGLVEQEGVLCDLGIAQLPTFVVGDELRAGRLVQVLPNYRVEERFAFAVFPAGGPSPAAARLATFLAERFGEMPPWDADIA